MPPPLESFDQKSRLQSRTVHLVIRYGVWITGLSLLLPQLIGSVFNIVYNYIQLEPLFDAQQRGLFVRTTVIYNLAVYPLAVGVWIGIVWLLHRPYARLLRDEQVDPKRLAWARRMAINLPWWGAAIGAVGWFLCIPVFLGALSLSSGRLDPRVYIHLPVSFSISALIATTHGFFILEMLAQRLLYPVLFRNAHPAETPGARPLSLRSHGLLWILSAGVCPIGSLLLLMFAPHEEGRIPWFGLSVGGIGIVFGLTTAWLVGRWVTEPVNRLKEAAGTVAAGDLNARVDLLRADEFGPLIDEFNLMVTELREKQILQETFGRHVGRQAAELILERDPGLGGFEETITVVFIDIRNFTARAEHSTPQEVVVVLNQFLTEMVEIVEQHGGMVNKFLGDGLMAIFGLHHFGPHDDDDANHAESAVAAGLEMLTRVEALNNRLAQQDQAPLAIGVGIHTGPAIVGSIGSPRRMEFTAIGNTVNIASRVESLTKEVGRPLLITAATRGALPPGINTEQLEPQHVKGQSEPLIVCCVKE